MVAIKDIEPLAVITSDSKDLDWVVVSTPALDGQRSLPMTLCVVMSENAARANPVHYHSSAGRCDVRMLSEYHCVKFTAQSICLGLWQPRRALPISLDNAFFDSEDTRAGNLMIPWTARRDA